MSACSRLKYINGIWLRHAVLHDCVPKSIAIPFSNDIFYCLKLTYVQLFII